MSQEEGSHSVKRELDCVVLAIHPSDRSMKPLAFLVTVDSCRSHYLWVRVVSDDVHTLINVPATPLCRRQAGSNQCSGRYANIAYRGVVLPLRESLWRCRAS